MKKLIGLPALLVCFWIGVTAGELSDGLLFYVPFESSAEAVLAKGATRPQTNLDLTAGRVGKGGVVTDKALRYNQLNNIDLAAGTVAFWVRPERAGDAPAGNFEFFRAVHLTLAYTDHSRALFFMTGKTVPEKGFGWDYGCGTDKIRNWPANEWRHLAITFDRNAKTKQLYIDGQLAAANSTDLFPLEMAPSDLLEFGNNAPGVYDEIMIWNRPLPVREISMLAAVPEKVAAELTGGQNTVPAPAPEAAPLKDQLTFHVSFDQQSTPDWSAGSYVGKAKEPGKSSAGVVNQAFASPRIDYDSRDIVSPQAGTVAFWFRPNDAFAGRKATVSLFRAGHLNFALFPDGVNFMTGNTVNGAFGWDYSCGGNIDWKPGEWHHLAVTFDREAKTKTVYLDGKTVKTSVTDRFPESIQPDGEFFLEGGSLGDYDELGVWRRALTPAEIAQLCAYPKMLPELLGVKTVSVLTDTAVQQGARQLLADSGSPIQKIKLDCPDIVPEKTVVAPGEAFAMPITLCNNSLQTVKGELTLTLRDFWLHSLQSETISLSLKSGESKTLERTYQVKDRGIYKIEAVFTADGKSKLVDVGSFGSWQQQQKPNPDSFFGNHVNSWADGAYLRQAAKLGQNWMRNHNMLQALWWIKVQPQPGEFVWTQDLVMQQLKELEMPVLGQLFTTPNWAAADGPRPETGGYNQCLKPDLAAFDMYVYQTVSRYKGQVHYWEIWNEPDVSMFWKGTPEEFAAMVKVAVAAVRRADPSAKVMAAGYTTAGQVWHRRAAKAGALKGLDILSFHCYSNINEPLEITQSKLKSNIEHFQSLVVSEGDGKRLPLWDSEGGLSSTSFLRGGDFPQLAPEDKREPMNYRQAALRVVEFEALLMSEGLQKNFMYLQNKVGRNDPEVFNNLSTLDVNNAPKPYLMARSAMQELLDYSRFEALVKKTPGRFWGFVFQSNLTANKSTAMLFCGPKGEIELTAKWPEITRKIDLMGNVVPFAGKTVTVTEEPFYLEFAADAGTVAAILDKAEIKVVTAPEPLVEPEKSAKGHGVPPLPDFPAPAEAPAKQFTVDLRQYCTMGLADDVAGDGKGGWADEGDLNDMRDLKVGKRVLSGVTFDLIDPATNQKRSVITLKSRNLTPTFPEKVEGIKINQKVRVLYFLHAAAWGAPGVIGEYVVHYADGSKEIIPMDIPRNCNNWWFGYDATEISHPVPVQVTNTADGEPAWRYLRVFEWQNPWPEKEIIELDIVSKAGSQTPIVLAISGVKK